MQLPLRGVASSCSISLLRALSPALSKLHIKRQGQGKGCGLVVKHLSWMQDILGFNLRLPKGKRQQEGHDEEGKGQDGEGT